MKIAMAVVMRDSKVLIQRRRRGSAYVYEFPGGKVDGAESFAEAACRELNEETGLIHQKIIREFIVDGRDGSTQIGFVLIEIGKLDQPRVTDERREQTFSWFLPNEIPLSDFHLPDRIFIQQLIGS